MTKKKKNSFGSASVALGVVGLVVFPIVCSTLAIIFGAIGMNKGQSGSKAGLTLGIVGWCLMLVMALFLF